MKQLPVIMEKEFREKVSSGEKVVIQFSDVTCQKCKVVENQLANEQEGIGADISKLNLSENVEVAAEFGLMSVPQVFVFENGEVSKAYRGAGESMQAISELQQ